MAAMNAEQTRQSLGPFLRGETLSDEQLNQVSLYLALLLKWNARINLTSVRGEEEMLTRHFGESFFAASSIFSAAPAASAIDLGSGAGFPGLPIAIYAPQTSVTLIESQNKKATFLREVVRELGLRNVEVFYGRGEAYAHTADLVTLRAVERLDEAVALAQKMVAPGGRLALMVGTGPDLGLPPEFDWKVGEVIPNSARRQLIVGTKNKEPR